MGTHSTGSLVSERRGHDKQNCILCKVCALRFVFVFQACQSCSTGMPRIIKLTCYVPQPVSLDFEVFLLLYMSWRLTAQPLLPTYGRRKMCQRPDVGIACPPGLTLSLAQQGLMPRLDTLADGNCGIHAFIISLVCKAALWLDVSDPPTRPYPNNQFVNQPSNQSIGQPMSQSINRKINQSKTTDQSDDH